MGIIFSNQNWVQILIGLFIWVLFAIVFFHFTQRFGRYIFILFFIFYIVLFIIKPQISFCATLVAGLVIIMRERLLSKKKRKYKKAIAKFERGGIRRGLTPPEIAAVFGKPFHHIFTLVVVSLLEKGFVVIYDERGLLLRVSDSMQTRTHSLNAEKRAKLRRQGAQELKQIIYLFEEPFLELLEQENGKGIAEIDFSVTVKPFFQSVAERIGGFDLNETRDYYQRIVQKLESGNSKTPSDFYINRGIEWKLLGMYLDGNYTLSFHEHPKWFFDPKDASEKKQSNNTLISWITSLEEAIKSGLSLEDFYLGKAMNENSSEVLKEIIHATYHV
jgi:hypothetical protein